MKHQQIIIKKVKGKGHAGHHGGEWKVAYADFITALMAFFLLMWLIAILSQDKKEDMAQYFKSFSYMSMGGSGLLDKSDGLMGAGGPDKASFVIAAPAGGPNHLTKEEMNRKIQKEVEEKLGDVKGQVLVDNIENGVRIQLVDSEGSPMFALGSPELTANAKRILKTMAGNIKDQPNDVIIEGHTDALNYSSSKYTNWELSTERASAARKALEQNGFNPDRLARVAGYASKSPLIKDNPNDPRNRRISIILVYEGKNSPPQTGNGLTADLVGVNKAMKSPVSSKPAL
jgi:chemotaxis protein MotB